MRERTYRATPITVDGLRTYDHEPPTEAAVLAWQDEGRSPVLHEKQKAVVRRAMPVVARALDLASGTVQPDSAYGDR